MSELRDCPRCLKPSKAKNFRRGICSACYQSDRYADPVIREHLLKLDRARKSNLSDEAYAGMRARIDRWRVANPEKVKGYKEKYQKANPRPTKAIERGTRLEVQIGGQVVKARALDGCFRLPNEGTKHRFGVLVQIAGKPETILTSQIVKRRAS